MLSPEYFEFVLNCFVEGHRYEVPNDAGYYFTDIIFENRHLCDLKVTSGLIGVSDAFNTDFFAGIDAKFPLGNFPVELAIANTGSEQLVTFSRILFSKMPVARVELAMKRKTKFEPDQFSVDSGTACYFDIDAIDELDEDADLIDEIEKSWKLSMHTRAHVMSTRVLITTLRSSRQGWVMAATNPILLTMRVTIFVSLSPTLGYFSNSKEGGLDQRSLNTNSV